MVLEKQELYRAKTAYDVIYINKDLYKILFKKAFVFEDAKKDILNLFSITTKDTGEKIGYCYSDYQYCPLNISLSGNKGSGRVFFYKNFNIKGDKTKLATSTKKGYNDGYFSMFSALKEAVLSEEIYKTFPQKSFRTLAVIDMKEDFIFDNIYLDDKGSEHVNPQTYRRCLEIRYASDNTFERISNVLFEKKEIKNIDDKIALLESYKFINKFLHGSWSFGNISIDANMLDFDTSFFLSEYAPLYSNTNKYKESYFGFEYKGSMIMLSNLYDFDKTNFENLYKKYCYDFFMEKLGLDKSFENEDFKKVFDKFFTLSSSIIPHSIYQNCTDKNSSKINIYNFSKFFRFIFFDFTKTNAIRLLFNDYLKIEDKSKFKTITSSFFKTKTDEEYFLEGLDFINLFFKSFEKIKITDKIKEKAFLENTEKTPLLPQSDTYLKLYDFYMRYGGKKCTEIIELLLQTCHNENNKFCFNIFDEGICYLKYENNFFKVFFEPFEKVKFAKIITKDNEYLIKNYNIHKKRILISENIKIIENNFTILINGEKEIKIQF